MGPNCSMALTTLRPNSPYPILTIQGKQGSAKVLQQEF
jgi:hypothetical protein